MNFNTSIVDQRVSKLMEDIRAPARDVLNIADDGRLKSLAFVYLCVKELLDLDQDVVIDCLTEGGGDFGVDALHISEEIDGEFAVTLFQGKYKTNLEGNANFPVGGLESLVQAVRHIFDPTSDLGAINDRLRVRVEEIRSLIRDGYLPRVRAVCCNNGLRWPADGDTTITRAGLGDQVTWEHVNHDTLVRLMQRTQKVDATLRLTGRAIIEDLAFSRVCVGRIPVVEIADLMGTHGDRLLERNIRRYLGLSGNRVNEGIRTTLRSANAADFYLFNNGITLVCDDFAYNALQQADYQVKVTNLQIVNGGQTCMTIHRTSLDGPLPGEATVMVRLYKLPRDREDLALRITHATNSQNPVDLKDLRANDEVQQLLETSMRDLGYNYRRKRVEGSVGSREMTSGAVAEAVLAVWRLEPHRAKFYAREHFGKLYDTIFSDSLNAAQAIAAVLLFRIAENHRRRPAPADPLFVRYASCFIAMQMGRRLLSALKLLDISGLDHRNFARARELIEAHGEAWFGGSCADVDQALKALYGDREVSLQQLSATFRRGDLFAHLKAGSAP
ncbi:MAG: putative abortive infection phage resistance protein [Actinomycetota bacterium]